MARLYISRAMARLYISMKGDALIALSHLVLLVIIKF